MFLEAVFGVIPCLLLAGATTWARRQKAPGRARYVAALAVGALLGVGIGVLFSLASAPGAGILLCRAGLFAPLGGLIALALVLVAEGGEGAG